MKNLFLLTICFTFCSFTARAQAFSDFFEDKTLRIDYFFSGNASHQNISLDELCSLPGWAGRRHHLSQLPLKGNGQIEMTDKESGTTIYRTSFSTLFQEWLIEGEAKEINRGFENVYLLPFPKEPVEITITLYDTKQNLLTSFKHLVNPKDILIRQQGMDSVTPHQYLVKSGLPENCIDVAILAEGYTAGEMELFHKDARIACEALFEHEPFAKMKNRFNVIAVESASIDSGVSVPGDNRWKNTAFSSHFNTFYSDRYLTTSRVKNIHNALTGIPYEHIIILANTDVYGGGGIYNAFTLTTAHHYNFKPVVVHEFGHSFAGLADEYFYPGQDIFDQMYDTKTEPWEQNITTLVDFDSKWKDLLPTNTPIPTDLAGKGNYEIGVYEGAGYSARGIFRPSPDCRMKTNTATVFCPACQRAIERLINFYTQ